MWATLRVADSFSGLLHQLVFVAESSMISVCWTSDNLIGLIKFFKFIQQASSNMYAITNLATCVNLALIIAVRLDISSCDLHTGRNLAPWCFHHARAQTLTVGGTVVDRLCSSAVSGQDC